MSPTDTSAATQADTLSLVVIAEPEGAEQRLTVLDFSNALWRLAELVVLATYVDGDAGQSRVELGGYSEVKSRHVEILRLGYASPVEIGLAVASGAAATRTALQVLIYGMKRLYGIDLELATHRAELRARFSEAERRVEELDALAEKPSWARVIDDAEKLHDFPPLQGQSAVLSDEELG